MMNDKQQIEELKNILINSKAVTFGKNVQKPYSQYRYDKFFLSNNDGYLTVDYSKFAEALYNANCRQVPEGAIVVDKEYLKTELQGLELQVRKATAKDFIFKVESYLGYNDDNETFTKKELLLILAEIAKEQYGVEVDE